jgi:hypothetical protein
LTRVYAWRNVNVLVMIDGVPPEAHGALIYALSGCLLIVVEMLANQQNKMNETTKCKAIVLDRDADNGKYVNKRVTNASQTGRVISLDVGRKDIDVRSSS